MMMAKDSTPDRTRLSAASVALLESAVQKYLATPADESGLQPALRSIASEARERQMRAEELLLALKDVWYALPQVVAEKNSERQNKMLQRVVTLCIREYYSD
jgi:hypothetical protein